MALCPPSLPDLSDALQLLLAPSSQATGWWPITVSLSCCAQSPARQELWAHGGPAAHLRGLLPESAPQSLCPAGPRQGSQEDLPVLVLRGVSLTSPWAMAVSW